MPPANTAEFYAKLGQALFDSRVEVRKKASLDWLNHVKEIMPVTGAAPADSSVEADPLACKPLRDALEWISKNYVRSTNEKYRKQGVALLKELVMHRPPKFPIADDVVKYLVDIHIQLLNDQSEDVRWNAMDILKHIVLNIRSSVYLSFPDILRQLVKIVPQMAVGERDQPQFTKVYTGIVDLTRGMLNVVQTQIAKTQGAPAFDMPAFIAVVKQGLEQHAHNPAVCAYITQSCLKPFREMEHVHVIEYLHDYLSELLVLLDAPPSNPTSQTPAQAAIALRDMQAPVAAAFKTNLEEATKGQPPIPCADRYNCMVAVLDVLEPKHGTNSIKTCLQWMTTLLQYMSAADEIRLLPLLARMVRSVIPHVAGDQTREASRVNEKLSILMERYGDDSVNANSINFDELLSFVMLSLGEPSMRMTSLNWIALVHGKNQAVCDAIIEALNGRVLECVSDSSEDVNKKTFEVLCNLARRDEARWEAFMRQWIHVVSHNRNQLMPRIPMAVKQLQVQAHDATFPPEFVMVTLSRLLSSHADKFFVTQIVTTLSMMLITAPELTALRNMLKGGVAECASTFRGLYACWAYSAVWAVALCLLARAYQEAHCIVHFIAEHDPSAHTLLQLDRLIQLLETPAFAFVRNALTMPRENPYLVRTLYTILMTLPQSSPNFVSLQTRLHNAAQLQSTLTAPDAPHGVPVSSEGLFDTVFAQAQQDLATAEAAPSHHS